MTCFKDILEQFRAIDELRISFTNKRLNHAYLLEGKPGIGKYTLAKAVAARFLCQNPINNDSCGKCNSCRLLQSSNHPDFLELPREPGELRIRRFSTRQGSSTEVIDHIPVLEFMRLKPMLGNGRVCIIPDIERINIEAANAFLKTLEEPPANSLLLLTSANKDRLLATINSRCRIIGMTPLSEKCIKDQLIKHNNCNTTEAEKFAQLSEGSLGRALSLQDGEILGSWHEICTINDYRSPAEAVIFANRLNNKIKSSRDSYTKRQAVLFYLDLLALYVRREMRSGLPARNGYQALLALWDAAETICANVRPELVTINAVMSTITALHKG